MWEKGTGQHPSSLVVAGVRDVLGMTEPVAGNQPWEGPSMEVVLCLLFQQQAVALQQQVAADINLNSATAPDPEALE